MLPTITPNTLLIAINLPEETVCRIARQRLVGRRSQKLYHIHIYIHTCMYIQHTHDVLVHVCSVNLVYCVVVLYMYAY